MARKRFLRILLWSLTVLWLGLIWFFSAQSGDASGAMSGGLTKKLLTLLCPGFPSMAAPEQTELFAAVHFLVRKGAHFSEYLVLAVLLFSALAQHLRCKPAWLLAAAGSLLCAAADETHQMFTAGRGPAVRDVCIDFAGAAAGLLLAALVLHLFRRHLAKKRLRKQKNGL